MRNLLRLLFLSWTTAIFALTGCAASTSATSQPGSIWRVVSYNIHHGAGVDGKLDLARIAAVIKAQNPDLVALQEVDDRTRRTDGVDQTARIAALAGLPHYRFGKAMNHDGGGYGEAVLSRHPIIKTKNLILPASPEHEPRAALAVWIDRGGEVVVFIGTHLDHTDDPTDRIAQVNTINEHWRDQTFYPQLLAGDLNAEPDDQPLQRLGGLWTDASAVTPAPTYPAGKPTVRIDYVLYRPADRWRVIESRVIDEQIASDHRPLLTVLELTATDPTSH